MALGILPVNGKTAVAFADACSFELAASTYNVNAIATPSDAADG